MAEPKHTPGRLVVGHIPTWISTEGDPYGSGPMHVADVRGWGHLTGLGACNFTAGKAETIQNANAQRIVLAWNCHDELLAACEAQERVEAHIVACAACAEESCAEAIRLNVEAVTLRRAAIANAGGSR
jgi:hypothetical protein